MSCVPQTRFLKGRVKSLRASASIKSHFCCLDDLREDLAPKSAFTLIELLVTITIVLVLAALIVPAAKSMIESSQTGVCAGNLRGIGAASITYAGENNGRFPAVYSASSDQTWNMLLTDGGYLQKASVGQTSAMVCPSQQPKRWTSPSLTYGMRLPPRHDWYGCSYTYNVAGGRVRDLEGADYGELSKFMIMGDSVYTGSAPIEGNKQCYYFTTTSSDSHAIHLRHNKHGNFLFADGHVEAMNRDSLTSDPVNPTIPTQISVSKPQ